ncbi:MAG: restriction endonuclease subunit R [Calditrichaeota bacterium]|nr:MAG: restriction endonuclease subunit R [Calditrichota bacterium]
MNEAETRAELIDPKLKASGWGEIEDTKILREFYFTIGKLQTGGQRTKPLQADYILTYKNQKLAVVEAKSAELPIGEGVAQAKNYADKLHIPFAYSSNGNEIYEINMSTGTEKDVAGFPTPAELWQRVVKTHGRASQRWRDAFNDIPYEDIGGSKPLRFYQEIAVNKALWAVAEGKERILLTLATGTGKTFIAFQIAWKLFYSRWNLTSTSSATEYFARRPRILFLADRNILANQAFNAFNAFPEDALVRINPAEIRNNGRVPTNGSIFFTIFQTFMSGPDNSPYFGQYPKDYFDFIIIDECHRGGANDESNWRDIMDYFSPAVQLGLTATPKRTHNIDTYTYFGDPVYIYSLKEGINDGFLTPFRVKRIQTTIDEYVYTPDDTVIEGEVEEGKIYVETEFNRIIEIKAREKKRVQIVLDEINQKQKTIIFCATQDHALAVRDLVNQNKESSDPSYCQRVTANDGALGEQHLREFQDNEKTIPTVLTTSQKLSTGVDARNIRNIVLLRPINTMIEFKQIVGRGTRLFEGKEYFTIYDFVDAYHHFSDPEWDGEPLEPEIPARTDPPPDNPTGPPDSPPQPPVSRTRLIIKLNDGKEREIQHMIATSFWNADGRPISAEEFLENLYGKLPEFFSDEAELRKIWSVPATRKSLLQQLEEAGFGKDELRNLQRLINAEKSDLFDVLEYVSFAVKPITREERVVNASSQIFDGLADKQKDFLSFVLSKYIETGVSELDQEKLPNLLELKYQSITDAAVALGGVDSIKNTFIEFQKYLYDQKAA